jgi:ribonuclease R
MNIEENIFHFLNKYPNQIFKVGELAKRLSLKTISEIEELKRTLKLMVKEKKISQSSRKRFGHFKPDHSKLIGKFTRLKSGGGICIPFDKEFPRVEISQQFSDTALDDDVVSVNVFPIRQIRGKRVEQELNSVDGEIVEIIRRSTKKYTGKLEKTKNFFFVIPDEKSIGRDVYIPKGKTLGARPGSKIAFTITDWKSRDLNPEGSIVEKYGYAGNMNAELISVIHSFGLSTEFPKQVSHEAEKIETAIPLGEISSRLDLRNDIIFTIDPDDAKDFDDAVSIKKLDSNLYELGIHIADVSHYVKPGSQLDSEAFERGTSVYLANEVIPMLPESLSNNICSLIANQDRLTFSVIVQITNSGEVKKYKITKSVIQNKRRFSYEEVQKILNDKKGDYYDILNEMLNLSKVLLKIRIKNGSLDFDTSEVKFKYGKHGEPVDVIKKVRLDSHRLIEEFMLLANRLVAEHIKSQKIKSFVYRVHDKPEKEKLNELSEFVSKFGYSFQSERTITSKSIQKLLADIKGKDDEELINEVTIRSMAKAIYSDSNIGHFGLGFKYYTHFTSPIRRYPDLVVHRLLFDSISQNKKKKIESIQDISYICEHSSARERNAVDAERLSVKVMQTEFMKQHVGESFKGIIAGVIRYGIFVEIIDFLIEGFVPLRNIEDDYYTFDEKNYAIVGRRMKKCYRLGDKLEVQVIKVDTEDQKIDLKILD